MAFTNEEIDAVIQRYLASEVSVSRTKTGSRDTTAIKRQVYDLLSTGLFLRPSSIFYLLWLASNRLRAVVAQQKTLLESIAEAAPNVSRVSKRVESTAELSNAAAALLDLSAAFNQRTSGVAGAVGPAVQRFQSSVTSFATTELTKNVVAQGAVIETAEELRALITSAWQQGTEIDTELRLRVDALQDALGNYRAVRLPETVFQSLVSKIQARLNELTLAMAASTAPRDSRAALLELLAMRTLLQRASSFRAPSSVLAPLTSDPKTGSFVDGGGTEATLLGTVSGPFNYAAGVALDIDVNQAAETLSTVLPGTSAAVMRSKVLSPWAAPPAGNPAAFLVNGVTTNTTPLVAWASGPVAAAALDAAYGSIVVTWDASTSQIVFTTNATSDLASLEVTGHADFITWAFEAGTPLFVAGTPVDIADVLLAIRQASSFVEVEEVRTEHLQGPATVSASVLTLHIHDGTDLDTDGTTTVVADANLEQLGVLPGHLLKVTLPAATRTIVSVDGNTLVLDASITAATDATYFIAPDLSEIPIGARVRLSSRAVPRNSRYARVSAVGLGTLTLDSSFTTDSVEASIFTSYLRVTAVGTSVDSDLDSASTAGSIAVGLATMTAMASLSKFSSPGSDFVNRGVSVGDAITLIAPSTDDYACNVTEVGVNYVVVAPPVPYEAGSWTFEIKSAGYVAFETLLAALETFEGALPDAAAMELVIRRLTAGARYSSTYATTIETYITALENLLTAIDAYAVPREPTLDRAVFLLREHGMDRALDLLLDLELTEFFTMRDDEVSYRTWLIRRSADVARELVPVTNNPRDAVSQWRTLATRQEAFDPRAATDKETNG